MTTPPVPDASALMQRALTLHTEGKSDAALAAAQEALAIDPNFVEALQYLGATYITRKKQFDRGIAYLERARALAPADPALLYTLGWCYEYAAHELSRGRGRWTAEGPLPTNELYDRAIAALRRSIALATDPGLRDDAVKLLESILGEDVNIDEIIAQES